MCTDCGNPSHIIGKSFVKDAKKIVGKDRLLEFNILEAGEGSLFEKSPNRPDYNSFTPVSKEEAGFIRKTMFELEKITGLKFIETNEWEDSWLIIFQTDYYPDYKQDTGWLNIAKNNGSKWMEASWAHGKGWTIPKNFRNWEKGTIRHELGHALGLRHPQGKGNNKKYTLRDTIMSYRGNDNKYFKFTELDREALRSIWQQDAGNKIYGSKFNDKLLGGKGDDSIYGGKGDDRIKGGPGDDLIHGGDWAKKVNKVWGNSGRDTFVVDDGAYGTVIQDFDVNQDSIGLSNLGDWSKKYSWEIRGGNTYINDGKGWQAKLKGQHDLNHANIVEI